MSASNKRITLPHFIANECESNKNFSLSDNQSVKTVKYITLKFVCLTSTNSNVLQLKCFMRRKRKEIRHMIVAYLQIAFPSGLTVQTAPGPQGLGSQGSGFSTHLWLSQT